MCEWLTFREKTNFPHFYQKDIMFHLSLSTYETLYDDVTFSPWAGCSELCVKGLVCNEQIKR